MQRGSSNAIKRRRDLDADIVAVLKSWMFSTDHVKHPYPTEEEKLELMRQTGIESKQFNNWFMNARKRLWKPMMVLQEEREQEEIYHEQNTAWNGQQGEFSNVIPGTHPITGAVSPPPSFPNDILAAFFPMGMKGIKRTGKARRLPREATEVLKEWMMSPEHFHHPYPTEEEKLNLSHQTNVSLPQLNNWFTNARKRLWKPAVTNGANVEVDTDFFRWRMLKGKEAKSAADKVQNQRMMTGIFGMENSVSSIEAPDSLLIHPAENLLMEAAVGKMKMEVPDFAPRASSLLDTAGHLSNLPLRDDSLLAVAQASKVIITESV